MKKIRFTEERIADKYSEQKMRCPTHLSIGQEAVAAAAGYALRLDDFAVSTHRAHAHYLGKGACLNKMIAEIYGKSTGCSAGKGGSMHLIDTSVGFMGSTAIVGGTIPVGVGLGLSIQLKKTDQISCVFVGDGAIEEGVFYESLNFALVRHLPVLFICENNLYSVYSPLSVRQPKNREIWKMVEGMGATVGSGDGNDVMESYQIISNSIEKLRSGSGPIFLEFSTYRWREHCGPNYDNDIGYRSEGEFLEWKTRDPICVFESKLLQSGVLSDTQLMDMNQNIESEIDEAFQFAEDSPFPSESDLSVGVYSDVKELIHAS